MKSKIVRKQFLFIFSTLSIVFSFVFISLSIRLEKPVQAGSDTLSLEELSSEFPILLRIPILNISSEIVHVGLTKEGVVEAPRDPKGVAWFTGSAMPGQIGTSIIDGHSGYKGNIQAVFDTLYKLKKGDKIYVTNEKGLDVVFTVRELRTYSSDTSPAEVFISKDDRSHLNLITCTGEWDKNKKSHTLRLVVFTDKEIPSP